MKLLINILVVCYLYMGCYFDLKAPWIAGGIVIVIFIGGILLIRKRGA